MEVGDWMGAMREAEESVRFGEETSGTLWIAGATILKARLAGMQGNLDQSEAYAAQAERLLLSIGASFLRVYLQIARGTSAIGAGQHWQAYEYLRRLFVAADPAFDSGIEFFGLADFVEAAVFSGNADCRSCRDRRSRARLGSDAGAVGRDDAALWQGTAGGA